MDFKCDELILGKKDADSRALTVNRTSLISRSGIFWGFWDCQTKKIPIGIFEGRNGEDLSKLCPKRADFWRILCCSLSDTTTYGIGAEVRRRL